MSQSQEIAALDATGQAELVRRREVSPAELVEGAIERLERLDPRIHAVVHRALDEARVRARAASLPDGPFRGVPFLLKDLGGTQAGQPYSGGMRALHRAGFRETVDSWLVRRFDAAGLVPLGRTSTPELGLLPTTEPEAFGPTRNPWSLGHGAGGSSGGSAAAVAAGIVPLAHASDGGGSIRIPASSCGLVGLKTTRGRCSFGPSAGERWSGFSVEFAVTRSVRDAATLLDAVAGPQCGDPYFAPPPSRPFGEAPGAKTGRLRVGILREPPANRGLELHPECRAAADRAAALLRDLGHDVDEAHPPALDDPATILTYVRVVGANVAQAVEGWGRRLGRALGPDDVEPLTWALAERSKEMTAPQLLDCIDEVHAFGRRLAAWWDEGWDLLVTPTTAQPPPEIGWLTSTREDPLRAFLRSAPFGAYTSPFNLSGQPAISLPLHQTADGLPVGAQIVAAYGREELLLSVAARLEEAAPWAGRRPAVFG